MRFSLCALFLVVAAAAFVAAPAASAAASHDRPAPFIIALDTSNFDEKVAHGEWLVAFKADWCGYCKRLHPDFESLARESIINVGEVDISKNSALAARFMISALPTVYHIVNGEIRTYTKTRSLNDIRDYITREEWRNDEPTPFWKSPLAPHFRVLGLTLSLGAMAQDYYKVLTEDYQFSQAAVIAIFVGAIIAAGIAFSFVLLFIMAFVDLIRGTKPAPAPQPRGATAQTTGAPAQAAATSAEPGQPAPTIGKSPRTKKID
ncbi:hypothetical protein CAOG_01497 [Capsaspora owczarzaki ATCC 30864]|uniref:Thioredoxin domain-containing protein n=1 Tax=Capsaspora owczarzaki (strain ATCC 30864) TaxID=595528 RepID=A0A0D2X141_CAPO3|nr:hypothetical protein CAOG_01497 [Capsaspora owczarzaki ATCC 30864]KJE90149.1 hypothetical protein CAOG_001497 [Capsaspora owczarzaki ATCC 30864]|eukprot:XP_004364365.1 hypothetical protein CAOG_01497 [Capsaspora owczarzaki ATCC 30864]